MLLCDFNHVTLNIYEKLSEKISIFDSNPVFLEIKYEFQPQEKNLKCQKCSIPFVLSSITFDLNGVYYKGELIYFTKSPPIIVLDTMISYRYGDMAGDKG